MIDVKVAVIKVNSYDIHARPTDIAGYHIISLNILFYISQCTASNLCKPSKRYGSESPLSCVNTFNGTGDVTDLHWHCLQTKAHGAISCC